jgi:hypothetical protein
MAASTGSSCPTSQPVSFEAKYFDNLSSSQKCCTSTSQANSVVSAYNAENPNNKIALSNGKVVAASCTAPNYCDDAPKATGDRQVSGTCTTTGNKCYAPAGASNSDSESGNQVSTGAIEAVNITLANPLKFSTVEGALTSIMSGLKNLVGVLAILMIVIGAIMYILSFGNPDNIKRAKSIIFAALVGLAIVIAAPAFLREISILLGWGDPTLPADVTQLTLTQIATNILVFLLSLVGVISLIVMIIAAIMLFVSFGNPDRRKAALEVLKAAIIGVVVAMSAMILVTTVAGFFE